MAVIKKSLISNSTSKKTVTKKSSPKSTPNPLAAAKMATAIKVARVTLARVM